MDRFLGRVLAFTRIAIAVAALAPALAEAATYYQDYGSTQEESIVVDPGTHSFQVDGIGFSKWTEWFLTYSGGTLVENDFSGIGAFDPEYTHTFSSGSIWIRAEIYDNNGVWEEAHRWYVTVGEPDLTRSNSNINKTTALAGETLSISFDVENIGSATANSGSVHYYWKQGSRSYTGTYQVGSDSYGSLSPGGSSAESFGYSIPTGTSAGTYYLYYWIDATSSTSESDENNNRFYWTISVVEPAVPNASIQVVPISALHAGETTSISATVTNTGNTTQAFGVGVEIREGGVVVDDVGSGSTPTLSPGQSSTVDLSYVVPVELGGAYVARAAAWDGAAGSGTWLDSDDEPFDVVLPSPPAGRVAYHSYTAYDAGEGSEPAYPLDGTIHVRELPSGTPDLVAQNTISAAVDHAHNPVFSDNGRQIVFMGLPAGSHFTDDRWAQALDIFLYDFVSGDVRNLSDEFGLDLVDPENPEESPEKISYDEDPTFWSDYGRFVVFKRDRQDLWLLDLETLAPPIAWTTDPTDEESGPQMSPDGLSVAFWQGVNQDDQEIYTRNACLDPCTRDETPRGRGYFPSYWGNGRLIFTSWDAPSSISPDVDDIYVLELPSGTPTPAEFNSADNDSDPFEIMDTLIGFSSMKENMNSPPKWDLWYGNPYSGQSAPLVPSHVSKHDLGGDFTNVVDPLACSTDADCADQWFCNGVEVCVSGSCAPGSDACDDGLACTLDSCEEATDQCTNAPNDAVCDNGIFCDGVESCDVLAGCVAGVDPCVGPDSDGDCSESCNEILQSCDAPDPDGSPCDDSLFCNGGDSCSGGSCSAHGGNPCNPYACYEVDDTCEGGGLELGVIGYYLLDGDGVDSSGGGNDGTLFGGISAAPDQFGVVGGALEFDGVDDYIELDHTPHTGQGDFSIFAWIRTEYENLGTGSTARTIINYGTTGGSCCPDPAANQELYLTMQGDGYLRFNLRASQGPVSDETVNDGRWHSVGVVHEAGIVQLYVDGVASGSPVSMQPDIQNGDGYIGRNGLTLPWANNAGLFWPGSISELRIWTRALSASEAQELFEVGDPPRVPSLSLWALMVLTVALIAATGLVGAKRRDPMAA